jgi:AcrR family transcriptional regulator
MPRIRAATIDEHKAITRAALLSAAHTLIDETGTAEISLAELALFAGVGRTTFYEYFTDRDDVIASLVEEELPVVLAGLIAGVDTSLPVLDRMAELATRTVEFVATDRVFGMILHQEVGRMGLEAQARIRDSHAQLSGEMASLYMKGVEDGVFRPMPPAIAGRLIQDTIMSGAKILISGAASVEETTDAVRRYLLGGLGHGSAPARSGHA